MKILEETEFTHIQQKLHRLYFYFSKYREDGDNMQQFSLFLYNHLFLERLLYQNPVVTDIILRERKPKQDQCNTFPFTFKIKKDSNLPFLLPAKNFLLGTFSSPKAVSPFHVLEVSFRTHLSLNVTLLKADIN